MSLVSLNCPLCGGLFQTEAARSGRQVVCPLCQAVVRVPPAAGSPTPSDASPSSDQDSPDLQSGAEESTVESSPDAPVDEVHIPTEEGGFIRLAEPVKKVRRGSQEVQLRQLSRAERARRRMRRNLFMLVLGLVILATALALLLKFS